MQRTMAEPAAPAATLLDALARAPAAAALVVAALDQQDDRKALRLAHPLLRDAVGEATTKLRLDSAAGAAGAARPPMARRWPLLEELAMRCPDLAALEALGAETWGRLHSLHVQTSGERYALDPPSARALAAALLQMPALSVLGLWRVALPGAFAALLDAPTFALRRVVLTRCDLDATALPHLSNAHWPLEELDISSNDFRAAAAGPALAALSQHARLRKLDVASCHLSAAGFKALVEAAWPALAYLDAGGAGVAFAGPHALGAAAFAGFPALEQLDLAEVVLGEAGAQVLAGRRWPRLRVLNLDSTVLGDAGLAALARGEWPALEELSLDDCGLSTASARTLACGPWRALRHLALGSNEFDDDDLAVLARGAWPALETLELFDNDFEEEPTLEEVRRWAPALVELRQ